MLHAGLDPSRRRLDVCLLDASGQAIEQTAAPPDGDGLAGWFAVARHDQPITAAIESMTGARFVHDELERHGWEVGFADAQKAKGLPPTPVVIPPTAIATSAPSGASVASAGRRSQTSTPPAASRRRSGTC
jgi:hypothetical protein